MRRGRRVRHRPHRLRRGAVRRGDPAIRYKQMGEARVLRRRAYGGGQASEKPQAARSRGAAGAQAAGDEYQSAADARESAGGNEAGIGSGKKPAPRGRGGGALRAAKSKAQAEASRALIGAVIDPSANSATSPVRAWLQSVSCLHCSGVCNNASMDISRDAKSQRLPGGCRTKSP